MQVLVALSRAGGEMLSRDDLNASCWEGRAVGEDSLQRCIARLRRLSETSDGEFSIVTTPRVGYRLAVRDRVETVPRTPQANMQRVLSSLGVLPFQDLSAACNQEYLADGLAEELLTDLAAIEGLRVPARTSAFTFKGANLGVSEIGRRLGVEALLEGSLRSDGDHLRITAHLVDVDTGFQLWSGRLDEAGGNILVLQARVSAAILSAVQAFLPSSANALAARSRTANPDAYALFLRGRYCWNIGSEEALGRAATMFRQALVLDPLYARAYAGLADVLTAMGNQLYLPPLEAYGGAKAAALKAIELEPGLSEAHGALGLVSLAQDWDFPGSLAALERAVTLDPQSSSARTHYARALMLGARHHEAIAQATKAVELDPLSLAASVRLGVVYRLARDFELAEQQLRRSLDLDPDHFPTHYHLAFTYAGAGRGAEATASAETAAEKGGWSVFALGALAYVHAVCGRSDEALRVLDEIHLSADASPLCPFDIAAIHAGLGDRDAAIRWLERSYSERDHATLTLNTDPCLDPLRDDPRFIELQTRVNAASGLPPASGA
jgi:TolB-like protein/Flp pilus assembly protein TadD